MHGSHIRETKKGPKILLIHFLAAILGHCLRASGVSVFFSAGGYSSNIYHESVI